MKAGQAWWPPVTTVLRRHEWGIPGWNKMASETQVQRKTLPKKTEWRTIEDNI